jgi:hypothetical protein
VRLARRVLARGRCRTLARATDGTSGSGSVGWIWGVCTGDSVRLVCSFGSTMEWSEVKMEVMGIVCLSVCRRGQDEMGLRVVFGCISLSTL